MTVDRLVCANCAGPVREGRCAVCRASRRQLRQGGLLDQLLGAVGPSGLAVLALVLVALVAILRHAGG